MPTTQEQKDRVQAFVDKVKAMPEVEDAIVDDYGRFGNFSIIIDKPKRGFILGKRITFRNIIPTAKKYAKEAGLIWRSNAVYCANNCMNMVDIDCQPYHPETNQFQEQL